MILTSLPDLPPRPETAANAAFRRAFYERWGRENAIVCGTAREAEYATLAQPLSIKLAWGGRERYVLADREVVVDDDNWLVLNAGARYGSVLRAPRPAWSFAVFFRPGLVDELRSLRRAAAGQALEQAMPAVPPRPFSQHLRRHDRRLTPRLRALRDAVLAGERDEDWLEIQLGALAEALLDAEAYERGTSDERPARATRDELLRRLRRGADFIESCATEPITLQQMADAACLSRCHFVREFGRLFGRTPHDALCAKRAALARRAIATGEADAERIAQAAGFGSRWSMRRALARFPAPAAD
ncbi:helix-turn-helix domain-containing protein [Aquabacterium humicola]|uniref:helix-turn-helix domain-containing protein n=1 Tax=Aquabacterium humicola TaxID=3237377 RepID=UPI002543A659|nr:helix-turn-helix domain-containing protein [Rubrivivax pictus]